MFGTDYEKLAAEILRQTDLKDLFKSERIENAVIKKIQDLDLENAEFTEWEYINDGPYQHKTPIKKKLKDEILSRIVPKAANDFYKIKKLEIIGQIKGLDIAAAIEKGLKDNISEKMDKILTDGKTVGLLN